MAKRMVEVGVADKMEKLNNAFDVDSSGNATFGANVEVDGNVIVNGADNIVDKDGNKLIGEKLFLHIYRDSSSNRVITFISKQSTFIAPSDLHPNWVLDSTYPHSILRAMIYELGTWYNVLDITSSRTAYYCYNSTIRTKDVNNYDREKSSIIPF